ncbi:MAG: TldD/PmbA family protein [archaeon]|nr:TldD/PmbA family protein [archaeon]
MSHNQELLDKAVEVAKSAGAKELIAKFIKNTEYQIRISNSQIDISKQWNEDILEVFLSIGRKINVLNIQDPSIEKIKQMIPKAIENLKELPKSLMYWGMDKNKHTYSKIDGLYDSRIEDFYEKAPELVNVAIQAGLDEGAKKVAGVLYFGKSTIGVKTGYGNGGIYDRSYYRMTMRSFVDAESSGQDVIAGRDLSDIENKFISAGKKSGKLAKMSIGGEQGKPGKYDVIMSPTVAGDIMGQITNGANPVMIIAGMSCLRKQLNKQIGPETLTVSDDPTIGEGLRSRPFDFEGVPSSKSPIIENGKLTGFLHNHSTAKLWNIGGFLQPILGLGQFGTKTTGNSYLGGIVGDFGPKILAPMPTNTVYEPGDYSLDEIIADCQKPTIYITSNWYTRFTNQREGLFSTIPRDGLFLIENGEIKKPVRKLRLAENLLGMCSRISAIGKDITQINWWEVMYPTFIPTIKVSDCNITAATE